MAIEHANTESVYKAINAIRKENFRAPSNIFKSYSELCELFEKKECFCLQNEKALFIMIPYHHAYYDMLFTAVDDESLRNNIDTLKQSWHTGWPICVSVIGKESEAGKIADLFGAAGFSLGKKLARTKRNLNYCNEKSSEFAHNLLLQPEETHVEAKESHAETDQSEQNFHFSTAALGDEKEILSLLLDEFDLYNDNIPELDDIIENIKKKQIVVVKDKDKIIGLHYFEIKNSIYYGIYDLMQKNYRKNFLIFDLGKFRDSFLLEKGIPVHRIVGWRDTSNKRLMRLCKLQNETFDGVVIYNMKYDV